MRLYSSLLYPTAEFSKADLSDDLILNISGEDTPRPRSQNETPQLYEKVFSAAESSEKRFRRRQSIIENAEREGSQDIVERAQRLLRDFE